MVTNKLKVGDKGLMFIDGQPIAVDKMIELLLNGKENSMPETIEKHQIYVEFSESLEELMKYRGLYKNSLDKVRVLSEKINSGEGHCRHLVALLNLAIEPCNRLLSIADEKLKQSQKDYTNSFYQLNF